MARRKQKVQQYPSASFFTKVAGVTQQNADGSARQAIVRRLKPGQTLFLVRDPRNKYDRNAVMVVAKLGLLRRLRQVGFLNADLAAEFAPLLDAGGRIDATVSEVTGGGGWLWWKKNYGVNIKLNVHEFTAEV